MSPAAYFPLLAATLAVELALATVLVPARARGRTLAALACANLVSHPLATLIALRVDAFVAVEVLVVAGEAAALTGVARLGTWRAVAVSLAANLATALLSLAWWG